MYYSVYVLNNGGLFSGETFSEILNTANEVVSEQHDVFKTQGNVFQMTYLFRITQCRQEVVQMGERMDQLPSMQCQCHRTFMFILVLVCHYMQNLTKDNRLDVLLMLFVGDSKEGY
jgi:hypothetical protein